ncbi:hypothetical protein HSE3_gp111 [Bacillus phage vB_BceM-HSE3]|nr:hypothetical protein HSE3_gp111 [Bacillus phage vB_BceM-HSE3]
MHSLYHEDNDLLSQVEGSVEVINIDLPEPFAIKDKIEGTLLPLHKNMAKYLNELIVGLPLTASQKLHNLDKDIWNLLVSKRLKVDEVTAELGKYKVVKINGEIVTIMLKEDKYPLEDLITEKLAPLKDKGYICLYKIHNLVMECLIYKFEDNEPACNGIGFELDLSSRFINVWNLAVLRDVEENVVTQIVPVPAPEVANYLASDLLEILNFDTMIETATTINMLQYLAEDLEQKVSLDEMFGFFKQANIIGSGKDIKGDVEKLDSSLKQEQGRMMIESIESNPFLGMDLKSQPFLKKASYLTEYSYSDMLHVLSTAFIFDDKPMPRLAHIANLIKYASMNTTHFRQLNKINSQE